MAEDPTWWEAVDVIFTVFAAIVTLAATYYAARSAGASERSIALAQSTIELEEQARGEAELARRESEAARREAELDRRRARLERVGEAVIAVFHEADMTQHTIQSRYVHLAQLAAERAKLRKALFGFGDELKTCDALANHDASPAGINQTLSSWQTALDEVRRAIKAIGPQEPNGT